MEVQSQTTVEAQQRYVHVSGRAEIGINTDGRLTLVFFDQAGNPINEADPFVFTNKPEGPEKRLKLVVQDLIASFSEAAFARHKATIDQVSPNTVSWADAERPTVQTQREMNPTGPPNP